MARFLREALSEAVEGERDVALALKEQLSVDWLLFHGYDWLSLDPSRGVLRDGEIDFILMHPDRGMLVLEIKSGDIEFNKGRWFRRAHGKPEAMKKSPVSQVINNLYGLRKLLCCEIGQQDLPFAYTHALVFPHCSFNGRLPSETVFVVTENQKASVVPVIWSQKDMPKLGQRVEALMGALSKKGTDLQAFEMVMNYLCGSPFRARHNRLHLLDKTLDRLDHCTKDQVELMDWINRTPKLVVEGVPGSGKTFMAMASAARFAKDGKRVLFLCFNRMLASDIRTRVEQNAVPEDHGTKGLIEVHSYHEFCEILSKKAKFAFGKRLHKDGSDKFFSKTCPELLVSACKKTGYRADVLIVDEGQDFTELMWESLNSLLHEETRYYIYHDPLQNLFETTGSIPKLGGEPPYRLRYNCRNTQKIIHLLERIVKTSIEPRHWSPLGLDPAIHDLFAVGQELADEEKQRKVRREAQLKLLEAHFSTYLNDGVGPERLLITGPFRREKSGLQDVASICGKPLVDHLDEWRTGKGILYATIKSLKGLEAGIVAVIDIPPLEGKTYFNRTDLYVACSRARSFVALFCHGEGLQQQLMNMGASGNAME